MPTEAEQAARGLQLIKEKKYAEAEALFKSSIASQEYELRKTVVADAKNADKNSGALQTTKQKAQGKALATAYNNLAIIYYDCGRYGDAETAYEHALSTYRQFFGRQQKFIVDCLNSLAAAYYKQGKYVDAERYYLEELELEKKLLKPENLAIAVTSNNLAAIYQKLGDDADAEKYFRWALNLCQGCKVTEAEKEQLADILNNLAVFYERKSNYADAREMVNKALNLENSRAKGSFSPNKVRSLLVLASIEKSTDLDLDASEDHYEEAIKLVQTSPQKRPDLECEALEKYAQLLLSERKFEEAEPIFEKALKDFIEAHGPDHPFVADCLSEFSLLMRRTGRLAEAEAKLRRALAIQEKTIGVDTVAYLTTLHRLAAVLSDEGRCKDADELYNAVLPKLKEKLGPMHPFVADTMDNWAVYVEKCGNKDTAEDLRASAKLIRRKIAQSLSPVYEMDTAKR